MVKKEYSTKEILLGLREESKRVKSELDKATSMLIYDKSTYKIESLIDRANRLYFNAVLNSKDISYLKISHFFCTAIQRKIPSSLAQSVRASDC